MVDDFAEALPSLAYLELCDDGNNLPDDGCNENCSAIDVGWICEDLPESPP